MLSLNTAYLSSNAIDNIAIPVSTDSYTAVPHRNLMHLVMSGFSSQGFDLDSSFLRVEPMDRLLVIEKMLSLGLITLEQAMEMGVGN